MKFNWSGWILRPGLAALAMYLTEWGLKAILPYGRITTIVKVLVGVGVFCAAAFFLKAVTREDISAFTRKKKAS